MREIKFRQLIGGEWHYWGFIGNVFVGPSTQMSTGKMPPSYQYIGLKDKNGNGKEIYEADVILVDDTKWLVEPIGTEERDGGAYGICVSPNGNGEAYFIDHSILRGEVIGNIYENPTLLEG